MLSVKEGQYFISGKTRKLIIWKIIASLGIGEMNCYKGRYNSQTLFLLGFLVTAGCSVHHDGDDLCLGSKTVTRIIWLHRCWRRNVLVATMRCWWRIWSLWSPTFKRCHQHRYWVTDIHKSSPTLISVTNITFTELFDHFSPRKLWKKPKNPLSLGPCFGFFYLAIFYLTN